MTVTPGDGYSAARVDGTKPPLQPEEQWRYALSAEALVIDAERAGRRVRATLHRDPPPRLLTRAFRWIQPMPDRARDAVP